MVFWGWPLSGGGRSVGDGVLPRFDVRRGSPAVDSWQTVWQNHAFAFIFPFSKFYEIFTTKIISTSITTSRRITSLVQRLRLSFIIVAFQEPHLYQHKLLLSASRLCHHRFVAIRRQPTLRRNHARRMFTATLDLGVVGLTLNLGSLRQTAL